MRLFAKHFFYIIFTATDIMKKITISLTDPFRSIEMKLHEATVFPQDGIK